MDIMTFAAAMPLLATKIRLSACAKKGCGTIGWCPNEKMGLK
jgi:hypothetical protein